MFGQYVYLLVLHVSTHTCTRIHVHVDKILVWTEVSRVEAHPMIKISYAAEYCIFKPLIFYYSLTTVMNTQETDYKDRCEDVFPNNGLYVYIDIVHIL